MKQQNFLGETDKKQMENIQEGFTSEMFSSNIEPDLDSMTEEEQLLYALKISMQDQPTASATHYPEEILEDSKHEIHCKQSTSGEPSPVSKREPKDTKGKIKKSKAAAIATRG